MHRRPYEKLIVWREAHTLCLLIYTLAKAYPMEERFRLVSQMCKAAYSVPMNIAEGNMRRTHKEKQHFLTIAAASLEELHYQCLLSRDLKFISQQQFEDTDDHIQRISYLLTRLHHSLKKSSDSSASSVSSASSIMEPPPPSSNHPSS